MLTKSICKQCRNQQAQIKPWNSVDEFRWKKGFVNCPVAVMHKGAIGGSLDTMGFSVPIDNPPAWCPMSLEHLMMEQK